MLRVHVFSCKWPKDEADALNRESGRIYSRVLVNHYRVYRHSDHWLSCYAAKKLDDFYRVDDSPLLHSHSIDAAQEGFYRALKTAQVNRRNGIEVRYPYQRKRYRTTIWKESGIRVRDGFLLLSRAKGLEPICVPLPSLLTPWPEEAFREARLVWNRAARHYEWHLVVEDGTLPPDEPSGDGVAAIDLGEIHPVTISDGQETIVISARALRANRQYTAQRLSEIQRQQGVKVKGSRAWRRLQRRKNRFLAQQKRRARDIEHKVSRAVVDVAVERSIGTLVIGDVRDVADGKRLNRVGQQKISSWSHGRQRQYIEYKAEAEGIEIPDVMDEAYSTQTCPQCGERHKPTGRVYICPACGFVSHRDAVGSANILSRYVYGDVGHVVPPSTVKYRQPFGRADEHETEWPFTLQREGKRSPLDTGQVASAGVASPPRL